MKADTESDSVKIAGLICKNFTVPYSRQMGEASIQDYLEEEELVGISDVDTRAIVRHIRSKGAMNGIISSEIFDLKKLKKLLAKAPDMDGLELSSHVSTKKAYTIGEPSAKHKVAVLDLGTKQNILRNFVRRDCFVKVFPAKASIEEIMGFAPDGLFISNGPGDPGAMDYAVDTAKEMLKQEKPMFGICTIEGIRIVGKPAFSVQYHPEASPGPHDADYLFDQFVGLIEEKKN